MFKDLFKRCVHQWKVIDRTKYIGKTTGRTRVHGVMSCTKCGKTRNYYLSTFDE